MVTKYLDPKNDFAFKKIFGSEKNKSILIHFLNDMIQFEGSPIESVTFLKTTLDPEIRAQKSSIVDILCKDEKGNQYIVEMQVAKEKGFEKRAQYYASKAYISQAHVGGLYEDLKAVIFLAISDFIIFPQKPEYKSDHVILDRISYENDLKDFSFTFIELPKFNEEVDEFSGIVEKWCYFFKYAESTSPEDFLKLVGHDEMIEKAYAELNRINWNEEELLTYNQTEKYEHCQAAALRHVFDEGKIAVAKKMILDGMSIEKVCEMTDFNKEVIEKIAQTLDAPILV